MTPNANEPDKRVFDVAKPGKTAANAQSRPVIVGHRTLLQDPMVKSDDKKETKDDKLAPSQEPLASTSGKTITPSTPLSNETPAAKPSEDQTNTAHQDEQPAPEPTGDTDTQSPTNSTDQPKQPTASEDSAKQENLQKLVEEKKYYVPIGEQKRTRSIRRLLLIILGLLIIGIILADLLIDGGTIKTSIKAPVQIFHHQQ
ncbi:MAG TPA: hypothetical protein VLF90_01185 [Patescibacteria group bacterium]|nr:hypothetical protein [Patescibacteria group bacterium]